MVYAPVYARHYMYGHDRVCTLFEYYTKYTAQNFVTSPVPHPMSRTLFICALFPH